MPPISKSHRAVVFDLDETTGAWSLMNLAFQVYLRFKGEVPSTEMFVHHYLKRRGARPFLKSILKKMEEWKRIGRIDEVAIFTSTWNRDGWVTFLQECMELYAETPGLFKTCITCNKDSTLTFDEKSGGFRTMKDLSLVSPDAEQVVLIDDKPENASMDT